ncbi:membrane protein [Malassezia pachydermatis]|uniref:Large ribosomal subunit protein bL32m n=1 Tax=Malassezia pachydermatis TaxID=77020 RepID=A0A0M9VP04_9BASI|nr:membrane protein [Malassezia pachydermatis]KOS13889.1 membrane protein [Malassezia pachydermatis]
MVPILRSRSILQAFVATRYTLPTYTQHLTPVAGSSVASVLGAYASTWQSLLGRLLGQDAMSQGFALSPAGVRAAFSDAAIPEPSSLEWDGLLLAAPKKKVSHSRKAMRAANKGLKDRVNLVHCPGCGRPKLQHHLCENCFGDLTRGLKQNGRTGP